MSADHSSKRVYGFGLGTEELSNSTGGWGNLRMGEGIPWPQLLTRYPK
jgi:hypothetical protein